MRNSVMLDSAAPVYRFPSPPEALRRASAQLRIGGMTNDQLPMTQWPMPSIAYLAPEELGIGHCTLGISKSAPQWAIENKTPLSAVFVLALSFCPLRGTSCFFQSILLSFNHSGVAGEKAEGAKLFFPFGREFDDGSGKTHAEGVGLGVDATAGNLGGDIKRVCY